MRLKCAICGQCLEAPRSDTVTCSAACRQKRHRKLRTETPPLPSGTFDLLHVDLPLRSFDRALVEQWTSALNAPLFSTRYRRWEGGNLHQYIASSGWAVDALHPVHEGSSDVSVSESAMAFSCTCSAAADSGIAMTLPWRMASAPS